MGKNNGNPYLVCENLLSYDTRNSLKSGFCMTTLRFSHIYICDFASLHNVSKYVNHQWFIDFNSWPHYPFIILPDMITSYITTVNLCKTATLKKDQKCFFQDRLSLNAGQKYCRMGAFCNTFDLLYATSCH